MRPLTLIVRSLWFYRRTHLGVVLGAAVATAVLVGALAVGDSLKGSLRDAALSRLGRIDGAMVAPDRFFRAALADDIAREASKDTEMPPLRVAPAILTRGVVERLDRTARANTVQIVGVDQRFWEMFPTEPLLDGNEAEMVVLNEPLARRLGVAAGDTVRLRLPKPSALPTDAPLSEGLRSFLSLPVRVKAVATDRQFGRFSIEAGRLPPLNAFVPREWLARQLDRAARANALLVGVRDKGTPGMATRAANGATGKVFYQAEDAGLRLVNGAGPGAFELRSERVFIDPVIEKAVASGWPGYVGVLTYFVNELRVGEARTPYSSVTSLALLDANRAKPGSLNPDLALIPSVLQGLKDEEVLLNVWLAEDLKAKPGDELEMTYFVIGPRGALVAKTSRFRVADTKPFPVEALDRDLMPDYPGLAEANDCRDWDPGIPIDLDRIRPKDEKYWDDYRGTPKAVVTLASAQRMWANRYGSLTAIRTSGGHFRCIPETVPLMELGLVFRPVRQQALLAAEESMDFAGLFAGLSMFLVAAGLLLMALLFGLSVQQRAAQAGTLLATGCTPAKVRRMMLGEGAVLAAVGVALGAAAAVGYAHVVLGGLRALWPAAVGAVDVRFHVTAATMVLGTAGSFIVALATMLIVLWRQTRAPVRELLSAGGGAGAMKLSGGRGWGAAIALSLAALAGAGTIVAFAGRGRGAAAAGAFFGAGGLLLAAGLALCYGMLGRLARRAVHPAITLMGLAVRGSARRIGRSLAVVAMLACGVFVVAAVGANRRDLLSGAEKRSSGTGGFAFVAQTASPLAGDMNVKRRGAKWSPEDVPGVAIVPIRVAEGDDASCLNLNRPQRPLIWGVDPNLLAARKAFTFSQFAADVPPGDDWLALNRREPNGPIPAVVDQNTLDWSLRMKVGQTFSYPGGRSGEATVRIVAAVEGSILQGGVVVSEASFLEMFPSAGGYRMFLIDVPGESAGRVAAEMSSNRLLQDAGLELAPATARLAQFNAIEDAYISMFQVLGGLGVVLGSAGLGLVVFRNILERRGELAAFRAMGFSRGQIRGMVLGEHWGLLAMGLLCGVASALLAVVPALRAPGAHVPWASLSLTIVAVAASGGLWTWLAAATALRGPMIAALRNE